MGGNISGEYISVSYLNIKLPNKNFPDVRNIYTRTSYMIYILHNMESGLGMSILEVIYFNLFSLDITFVSFGCSFINVRNGQS